MHRHCGILINLATSSVMVSLQRLSQVEQRFQGGRWGDFILNLRGFWSHVRSTVCVSGGVLSAFRYRKLLWQYGGIVTAFLGRKCHSLSVSQGFRQ